MLRCEIRETSSSSTPRKLPQWRDAKEAWRRHLNNLCRQSHCKSAAAPRLHSPLADPSEGVCDAFLINQNGNTVTSLGLKHLGSKFAIANARKIGRAHV